MGNAKRVEVWGVVPVWGTSPLEAILVASSPIREKTPKPFRVGGRVAGGYASRIIRAALAFRTLAPLAPEAVLNLERS